MTITKTMMWTCVLRQMSRCTRKPTICICENKDADQLCSTCRLISAFVFAPWIVQYLFYLYHKLYSVTVQSGLCQTWSETQIIGFLTHRLKSFPNEQEYMSCLMEKTTICICENKDADQLRGNREANQRLCFRYSDSAVPLLLKSKISRF